MHRPLSLLRPSWLRLALLVLSPQFPIAHSFMLCCAVLYVASHTQQSRVVPRCSALHILARYDSHEAIDALPGRTNFNKQDQASLYPISCSSFQYFLENSNELLCLCSGDLPRCIMQLSEEACKPSEHF